jgi:succinate-acetate transporter protein
MDQTNQIKEWANPMPAGLVALAVACFGLFAILTGQVTGAAVPFLGCWLLGCFVVQVIVALLDLKGGNSAGGNTFLYFSAFFMLVGGLEMILGTFMRNSNIKLDSYIDGWAWLALMFVVILWTPAFFKAPLFLTLIVFALDFALPFIVLEKIGLWKEYKETFSHIAGWSLLVAGIFGIYLASAIIVNTAFGKKVYPNPGPLIK